MENLVGILITFAIIAYSAHRKAKQQRQNQLPTESSRKASWESEDADEEWEEDSEENLEEPEEFSPQTPDPLQDLIRKFKEEQAKAMRGEVSSAPVPQKKIIEAEQKTLSNEIPSGHREFEHRAKHFESTPTPKAPAHSYAPKKDFTQVPAHEFVEAEPVFTAKPKFVVSQDPSADVSFHEISLEQKASKRAPNLNLNIKETRKGFLWAKVLDDPRFKRRSPYPFTLDRWA